MAQINKLTSFILRWEGGFVNDPIDRGGATNKGITIATYRQFFGANKTVEDLKRITDEQWLYIFTAGFWKPWKADQIKSQSIANIVVDWAWASGPRTSIKQVQQLLDLHPDGIVGKQTLFAINNSDARSLFRKIQNARIQFVEKIVKCHPSQHRFIRGWKNRIAAIKFEDEAV